MGVSTTQGAGEALGRDWMPGCKHAAPDIRLLRYMLKFLSQDHKSNMFLFETRK